MGFRRLFIFIKNRFRKKKISLNSDFLQRVEPAIDEIIQNIGDLNYNQKTFDLIGSNTCFIQINALTLELKNLVEDLISLEKRFKYSSNYAVLSEIEDAKRFCHESFIHLYDVFNIIQSNSVDNVPNETLLSIISRLENDVIKIDNALKKISANLSETHHNYFDKHKLDEYLDISVIHSESKRNLMQICMMAYEGLISMPFLGHQDRAYQFLERYKAAMQNMMHCLVHEPLSSNQFEVAQHDLISSLESMRFCLNRQTKMGKALDIKIKLITQNIRRAIHEIDIPTTDFLQK